MRSLVDKGERQGELRTHRWNMNFSHR